MAEVGQQTVDFSSLVGRAAEESFVSLKELVEKSKSADLSDSDKKIGILKYVVKTQQRMLRLNVLAKWCQQVPLIQYCQELGTTLSNHDTCFTQAADSMFFMHEGLQQARAPVYDVPSAIEVLLTGSYQRLPKCIEDVGLQSTLNEDQQKPALKKLDTLVRAKLLEVSIPKEITEVKVTDGTVMLRVNGEFKVLITLGYRGHLSMWRILHMELLVGEGSGPVKLEESRRHVIGDDLERRMAAAENPFSILYSILHELCVALVMDTVIRQVQSLRHGRWKDAIRFERISDGSVGQGSVGTAHDAETESVSLRTPGLKLVYWLDIDKSSGSSDALACPFLKIEPGPDLQIKCLHSSFVIDHLTDTEAEFSLDQNCIDVEKLLLRAICCNRYTRLLEIYKELEKNVQICRASEDIHLEGPKSATDTDVQEKDNALKDRDYEGREVLRVRAFGSSFFTLGINIRNGRFFLLAPKNIISATALQECEEALNQGSISAAEAFTNLRNKSIMHLFACIARFFGLEVFDHGFASGKVPKNISNDQSLLLMGFPDFGNSYFLLMQLDKEFKPLFKLLEVQPDTAGNSQSLGDWNNVVCMKNIDISQMQMGEDEVGSSLVKYGNLLSLLTNNTQTDPVLHQNTSVGHGKEGHILTSSHQSVFSSIVDEVFELEKGSSGQVPPLPFASSPASQHRSSSANVPSMKAGTLFPKWEAGMLISRNNNIAEVSGASHNYHSSVRSQKNAKGLLQSDLASSVSTGLGRSHVNKILSASKSDQDLAMLRSPHTVGINFPAVNGNQSAVAGIQSARFYSPSQPPGSEADSDRLRIPRSSSWATPTLSQQPYSAACTNLDQETTCRLGRSSRKRTVSDLFLSIPSLMQMETAEGSSKRQKTSETLSSQLSVSQLSVSTELTSRSEGYSYADVIAEANKGNAPSSIYVSALLHVVRHCSLCIKHALLTSQMEVLGIPFVEEVDLRSTSSSTLWFRLPFAKNDMWQHICLRLGQPGSMCWDVKINDQHFRDLWELQKGSDHTPWNSGVRVASLSDVDSHIHYDSEGVILSYQSVEADSIKNLVADIQRLSNSRTFALGMRKLLGVRADDKSEEIGVNSDGKLLVAGGKSAVEIPDKLSEQIKRSFRIEAVGLMSLWFSFGSGVMARFVVEWESGKEGCTMHVSPDQLWPHTKFLEDFINGAEVASLLDCIRLTTGPLHALAAASRPARAAPVSGVTGVATGPPLSKQSGYLPSAGLVPSSSNTIVSQSSSLPIGSSGPSISGAAIGAHNHQSVTMLAAAAAGPSISGSPIGAQNHQHATMLAAAAAAAAAAAGRGGPGIVPSSLLPIDVSVVLRGPYWIRIIYRKKFAVDMRCFAGDQVWLQPATPPKGGPSVGGSLSCPQFRPFIMEHVAQELNGIDSNFAGAQQVAGVASLSSPSSGPQMSAANGTRTNLASNTGFPRSGSAVGLNRLGNSLLTASNLGVGNAGLPVRRSPGAGIPAHVRGELNTAIIGLGDDGGYGGGWVPVVALKKVLRGILKYLGVLWLFAQLPDLLKEILGSILKDNEGALLNLDQEQPALRFFVGGYVFAVSVHRVQLLLQVLSVKRFHHSQQQQNSATAQEELSQTEIGEICDYFSRRVASEPYDASRVASFITLLTLPISVLREFLKLIAWKKGLSQAQGGGDIAPVQKSRIELCLENHGGANVEGNLESSSVSKSSIHYNRAHNSVDFALTVVLDPALIPHINAAGGAAWLPYCVSVRLRYLFTESPNVSFLGMEGSHGGRACWSRVDDWEKCKQMVVRTVEVNGSSAGDANQGRLRVVADSVQRTLHVCLQGLRDGSGPVAIIGTV